MDSFDNLSDRIDSDFTKHGWTRIDKGKAVFYERDFLPYTLLRIMHPRKATISRRKRGMQAVKRFFDRFF